MSKHDKVLIKLRTKPPPSDIRWDELKALLEHFGYVMRTGNGSRRKFYHQEKNALIICHQPHPEPTVDKGCVVDICEHLKAHGFVH